MHKRDWVGVSSWVGIATALWIVAWVIAMAIPVFEDLLTLIVCSLFLCFFAVFEAELTLEQTALFGSWFTFIFTGMFGLHLNQGMWFASPRKMVLTFMNLFAICVGLILVSWKQPRHFFIETLLIDGNSVASVCTAQEYQFMTAPVPPAFPAPITRKQQHREKNDFISALWT